jgi:arabinogalactan oligomer / maltooligosaccharide transport system permease protein
MKTRTIFNPSYLLDLFGTGIFLFFILWLVSRLIADGLFPLASALSAIAVFIAMIYLRRRFTPLRWLGIGMALAMMFTIYPIIFTFYLSVTNMSSGHLMSKAQAISKLEAMQFLPENGTTYKWTAFISSQGEYALWLQPESGPGLLAKPGEPIQPVTPGQDGIGLLDESGIPTQIEGYERLTRNAVIPMINDLSAIYFGKIPQTVRIRSLGGAVESKSLYKYDASRDAIVNQQTGELYTPVEGTFTSESGETLTPGYIVSIGMRHFVEFLGNAGYRNSLGKIFIWNLAFSFFSVFISFAVGLVAALMFDDLPGKRIIRALLIVPWPIPVLISILIWRYMLHPDMGFFAPYLQALFGSSPDWFQNAFWTRLALITINVWLSYPYFYVITAGALQSIPEEINSAALVDGASVWQRFYYITLPLLMRILTPLIIASLTFNFNNFNVIFIFNAGLPAMAGTVVPMGQSDILISFIYRLAFVNTNIANYGLAAAITIMLFVLITAFVLIQTRFTKMFKEQ